MIYLGRANLKSISSGDIRKTAGLRVYLGKLRAGSPRGRPSAPAPAPKGAESYREEFESLMRHGCVGDATVEPAFSLRAAVSPREADARLA